MEIDSSLKSLELFKRMGLSLLQKGRSHPIFEKLLQQGGIFMKKIWIIGCLTILFTFFGSFFYPGLAQSERKIINFNAG